MPRFLDKSAAEAGHSDYPDTEMSHLEDSYPTLCRASPTALRTISGIADMGDPNQAFGQSIPIEANCNHMPGIGINSTTSMKPPGIMK